MYQWLSGSSEISITVFVLFILLFLLGIISILGAATVERYQFRTRKMPLQSFFSNYRYNDWLDRWAHSRGGTLFLAMMLIIIVLYIKYQEQKEKQADRQKLYIRN